MLPLELAAYAIAARRHETQAAIERQGGIAWYVAPARADVAPDSRSPVSSFPATAPQTAAISHPPESRSTDERSSCDDD